MAGVFVKKRNDKKKVRERIDKLIKGDMYNVYKVIYKG